MALIALVLVFASAFPLSYSFTEEEDVKLHFISSRATLINSTHYACDNNEKVLLLSTLNDDYCDCNDGSDENKTNACINGLFKCENRLHRSKILSTSKLNDGYCDCCDGSDEPLTTNCSDTCLQQSPALYDKLRSDFTTLTQVINSYSSEQNEAFFSYNKKGLLNIQAANERYLTLLRRKNLLSSYIHIASSQMSEDNEEYIDANGVRLASAVDALQELNSQLKRQDDIYASHRLIMDIYKQYGIFKDLHDECIEVGYGDYQCQLCFSHFSCHGEKKDQPKVKDFGEFKGFNRNVAFFDQGDSCGNYDLEKSAEVVFECGFKEEFQFIEKVNKCLYRFSYSSKMGCNNYKLDAINSDIADIMH